MLVRFGEAFAAAGFDCDSVDLAGEGESRWQHPQAEDLGATIHFV
jgi:hypothetical protein